MRSLVTLALLTSLATAQLQWQRAHVLSPRSGTAVAHDSTRDRLVLFGGFAAHRESSDTWEWDDDAWIHRLPPASPPARWSHMMAYASPASPPPPSSGSEETEAARPLARRLFCCRVTEPFAWRIP
jgi:hypothetical protein